VVVSGGKPEKSIAQLDKPTLNAQNAPRFTKRRDKHHKSL
jgi:hypothetical protein